MKDNRKRYKAECSCGKVFYATKSILQSWGMNECGIATCPNCKTFYNLTFNEATEMMDLRPWQEYIDKQKK